MSQNLYEIAITAIVVKDGKFLITRRSPNKKRFPGIWTVPGGKLEVSDYADMPKDTVYAWYNVLERTLKREVREEVGIEIDNIEYLTSLAMTHSDCPSLIISCIARYASGEIILQLEETDKHEWVSLKEAKEYPLIEGIYDELLMADLKLKGKDVGEWKKFSS